MDQKKLKSLILSAMMAALVCAATMAIQIPSPTNGYVNLGDCFVLLCGFILNPWSAFAAAGIGSALADLLSGYPHYAVATFLIKGCVALCAYILNRTVLGKFGYAVAAYVKTITDNSAFANFIFVKRK